MQSSNRQSVKVYSEGVASYSVDGLYDNVPRPASATILCVHVRDTKSLLFRARNQH